MWPVITCITALCVGAIDGFLSAALRRGKRWRFLIAGNPVMPDGQRRYRMEPFCRSAATLTMSYAVVLLALAASIFLTRILTVLPRGVMTGVLYVQGAVFVLGFVIHLVYMDCYCQNQRPDEIPESNHMC